MLSEMRHSASATPTSRAFAAADHRIKESNLTGECSRLCVRGAQRSAVPEREARSSESSHAEPTAGAAEMARLYHATRPRSTIPQTQYSPVIWALQGIEIRPGSRLQLAMILPETPPPRRTPQSLPLRERMWLAQRIALARFHGIQWADIALLEGMSERTLRYHFARWKEGLDRSGRPPAFC